MYIYYIKLKLAHGMALMLLVFGNGANTQITTDAFKIFSYSVNVTVELRRLLFHMSKVPHLIPGPEANYSDGGGGAL
jgi:hypothetical protein